jgi:hypothetical protein
LTEWLRAIVHDREVPPEGEAASEWLAEGLIRHRLWLEAQAKT